MKKLNIKEMKKVCGGGVWLTLGKIALIVLGTTFVSGIIDGYVRPLRCN